MYIPKHFEESNVTVLHGFIRQHPFATLITTTKDGLNADHLPVFLNTTDASQIRLQGHIATSNPLWKNISENSDCLIIFQGDNAYITPNWMPSKQINGKVVPTWNYTAVHVKGTIIFIHDESWKLELLDKLTNEHEEKFYKPWEVSDAPVEFINKLLPAIVGFEISVNEISGKFKLSQNQSPENRVGIANGLEAFGLELAQQISKT